MFKIGDKVVCVDNCGYIRLPENVIFTVLNISNHLNQAIKIDTNKYNIYNSYKQIYTGYFTNSRFIKLSEYRKLKLEKITK